METFRNAVLILGLISSLITILSFSTGIITISKLVKNKTEVVGGQSVPSEKGKSSWHVSLFEFIQQFGGHGTLCIVFMYLITMLFKLILPMGVSRLPAYSGG